MSEREAFEVWYKRVYWDFKYRGDNRVIYTPENDRYNHLNVDLAYQAWKAASAEVTGKALLDRFAAKALQGMLASGAPGKMETFVDNAYAFADAMIAKRSKS